MADLTVQQAFDLALKHHQAGRLDEAEGLYQQIIAVEPGHVESIHNLGVVALQMGRSDIAAIVLRRAVAVSPGFADAHSNLGNALLNLGQIKEAISAYRIAVALKPGFASALSNMGAALKAAGQFDESVMVCRQAISLLPNFPEAHNNLGNTLSAQGRFDAAVASFRDALAIAPRFTEAYSNLGSALAGLDKTGEAIAAFSRAIELEPRNVQALNNLGVALKNRGQVTEAIATLRQAIEFRPGFADAHYNLANALKIGGQLNEAISEYRMAIQVKPDYVDAHINLGTALSRQGRSDEAIAAYRLALVLAPDNVDALNNLGNILCDQGLLDEGVTAFKRAIALRPDHASAHSNYLMTLHYDADLDSADLARAHMRWADQHTRVPAECRPAHLNDRTPGRRLRIGYVSPDFRDHPVGRFVEPLFAHHDRHQYEILAYAQSSTQDALTLRLRAHTHEWIPTEALSDLALAERIRRDRVDILVDLSLHSAGNRLLTFAHKPAPVQVSWLGYPGSTGLDTIDYRLSDPYLDPPIIDSLIYTEQTVHLPETYWCYQPHVAACEIGELPALTAGHITFGSFNNSCKVRDQTIDVWARILHAVPESRLLLHVLEGSARQHVVDKFHNAGVAAERVEFVKRVSLPEYFKRYQQVDIALDTFPFAGGTTTCDALWMGVPVVSLVGRTAVGRSGLSILSNIGLAELVADSLEQYIKRAVELANDVNGLALLRETLRQRMQDSPLMDAPGFARNIEAAYRQMWRHWCHPRD